MKKIESLPKHVALDADSIAKKLDAPKSANIVVLGASANYLGLEIEDIEKAIAKIFRTKGEDVINQNIEAFRAGLKVARDYLA